MNEHIGDDAELYALGVLDAEERDAIDAHLATCGACSRRVAEAERVSLGLSAIDWSSTPAKRTTPRLNAAWYATAAAFVAALGLGSLFANQLAIANHLRQDDDVAFATIANSHFLHASFQAKTKDAPATKVLYARDGSWLYVVVDGRADGDRILDTSPSADTSPSTNASAPASNAALGIERARGNTAVAFIRPPHRVKTLALQDPAGNTLATVTLAYPRTAP